jgi:hypothetical protein
MSFPQYYVAGYQQTSAPGGNKHHPWLLIGSAAATVAGGMFLHRNPESLAALKDTLHLSSSKTKSATVSTPTMEIANPPNAALPQSSPPPPVVPTTTVIPSKPHLTTPLETTPAATPTPTTDSYTNQGISFNQGAKYATGAALLAAVTYGAHQTGMVSKAMEVATPVASQAYGAVASRMPSWSSVADLVSYIPLAEKVGGVFSAAKQSITASGSSVIEKAKAWSGNGSNL